MTDENTLDNTKEVLTSNTADDTAKKDDASQDVSLDDVGKEYQESKRVSKLAEKEYKKYSSAISEGEVDYDKIAEIYRGNKISDLALDKFCNDNGLESRDVKRKISNSNEEISELKARLQALEQRGEQKTFTDILKSELDSRGISTSEFAPYKDEFESELSDLSSLEDSIAIKKALNYVVGNKKATVKVPASDSVESSDDSDETWTLSKYNNYMNVRSQVVGNVKAAQEMEDYEQRQKKAGKPLFKQ